MPNKLFSTFFVCSLALLIKGQSLGRHKVVTISHTNTGYLAVDGNYRRDYLSQCADTRRRDAWPSPWISIDLGEQNEFTRIVVYGTTLGQWSQINLAGLELYLDNNRASSISSSGQAFVNFYHFNLGERKSARHVKFVLPGDKRLILCEVDILNDSQISKGRTTSASSQYGLWESSLAVDGNTRRHDPDVCQCCAATNQETDPWIKVDLESYEGMHISIDELRVDTIPRGGGFINYYEAFITPEKIGQEVKLTLSGNKLLVVCEFVIYGERVVSIDKTAKMSSQFYSWVPERGVDGDIRTNPNNDCNCCSATQHETNPWYAVDLGQVHKVERIVVYGRTDQQYYGQNFAGMTISLNSTVVKTIPTGTDWINFYAVQLTSTYYAKTVTLTLVGSNPLLVVCELLVYGDCMEGFFGTNCATQCHCDGKPCASLTGICPSGICKPGYERDTCSEKCNGKYGQNCTSQCGHCKDNKPCDHITGYCNKCSDGYINTDPFCETACQPGYYGTNCSKVCGNCRYNETCNFINGRCTECADGYYNSDATCNTACRNGTFGENCSTLCGNCRNNEYCDKSNGHCTECMDGYAHTEDPICKKKCLNGTYGRNCVGNCGACKDSKICNSVSGVCEDCMDGYLIASDRLCQSRCGWGKFGYNCSETCGNCRNNVTCGHENGGCTSCADGYNKSDTLCTTICNSGYYGYNCEKSCGSCFGDEICHHMNGSCSQCTEGFIGALCADRLILDENDPSSPISIVIGVCVSVVLILVIALIVFVILRRRRQPKAENPKLDFEETERTLYANNEAYDNSFPIAKEQTSLHAVKDAKDQSVRKVKETRKAEAVKEDCNSVQETETYYNFEVGVRIHQLWDYIRNKKPDGLEMEYSKLKDGLQYPVNDALANRAKNRYREMYPYDHSRVHLKVEREGESEFINASHVNGYDGKPKFIASQGPVEAMVDDFWRMIWQKGVTKIVMVTNLMEGGSHKCLQYWPDEGPVEFERIRIKLIKDDKCSDYSIRTLQITQDNETPRYVYQYHYKAWPDKDVPDSTWSLIQFWRKVFKDGGKNSTAPIVVHCSAGVGRTGTFIALDNLYHQAIDTGSITPFTIVEKLREQRVKMVQTSDQYIFLHEAVADALLFGTHYIWQSQFPDYYDFIIKKDRLREKIRLKIQFGYVEKSLEGKPNQITDTTHLSEDTIYSNEEIDPNASSLLQDKKMDPVFLPSLNGPKSYLLTKVPDKDSIDNCMKLIDEYNIKLVITIIEETNSSSSVWSVLEKQVCPLYSPGLLSDKKVGNLTERTVSYSKQNKTKPSQTQLKQIEIRLSLSGDPDHQAQAMLRLLDRINTLHPYISTKEPVMIQCRDGVTTSSVVSVLLNENLRLAKDGGQINILESVMLMRQTRKSCIGSYGAFKFIHDMVLNMVEKKQPEYVPEPEQLEEENIYQNT